MDSKTLLDAIPKYLDVAQTIFFWAVPICIVVIWARWRNREIAIGPITFEFPLAFIPGVLAVSGATIAIAISFFRLGSVLGTLDNKSWNEGLSRLWIHAWIFNPFSFTGDSLLNRVVDSIGYGSLVLAWWFCLLSVSALADYEDHPRWFRFALVLPFAAGLVSMAAIQRIYGIVLLRTSTGGDPLARTFALSVSDRKIVVIACAIFGAIAVSYIERRSLHLAEYKFLTWNNIGFLSNSSILPLLDCVLSKLISGTLISGLSLVTAWLFHSQKNPWWFVLLGTILTAVVFWAGYLLATVLPSPGRKREESGWW